MSDLIPTYEDLRHWLTFLGYFGAVLLACGVLFRLFQFIDVLTGWEDR